MPFMRTSTPLRPPAARMPGSAADSSAGATLSGQVRTASRGRWGRIWPRTWCVKRIQRVVKDGYNEACAPDGFINLEMAEMIGISKINYYEANGLEESKLDELRAWVKDVQTKRKELADLAAMEEANRMAAASGQMPPALGAGPPGAPPGPPSPPPQDPAGGAGVMPPGVPPAGPMMTEESAMQPM